MRLILFLDILLLLIWVSVFFNMLPFPPLDGSKVLGAFLPMDIFLKYMQLEPYGMAILVILVFTNFIIHTIKFYALEI